jgi:alpha-mannosidase
VRIAPPIVFFEDAEAELASRPVWSGELYLENHRGTYASQARTKRGNRRSEALLHEAELWAATAAVRTGAAYPHELLRSAWQTVLLNQFHDILPGSSIGWVYDQAAKEYAQIEADLEPVIAGAVAALGAEGEGGFVNSGPYEVDGVPAFGVGPRQVDGAVSVEQSENSITVANDAVVLVLDADGLITSLVDKATGRETVPPGEKGGLLQVFTDTPRQYDAWDVDIEYRRSGRDLVAADDVKVVEDGGDRAVVRVARTFNNSVIVQTFTLEAGRGAVDIETTVDWHERQHMLKFAFPVDVHTASARSEIQFGHIDRPTHTNTSWDEARFETCAHRWVHVAEAGWGLGVANDATYGHDVTRHARSGGGTFSVVRQTLLKSPLFPDPEADQGAHVFRTSLVPGGVAEAVRTGYRLNLPLRAVAAGAVAPLVSVANPAVAVETVKLAEDGSGAVVVRLYEAHGTRTEAVLDLGFAAASVAETDLLEREIEQAAVTASDDGSVSLALRPFQLVTLRMPRA